MRTKLACIPLFIGASVLLYFGSGMLIVVPGDPGEGYLRSLFAGRFLFGVLPTLLSAALLVLIGWLWDRSSGAANILKSIGRTFLCAVGAILLFWIGLIIIADIRNGFT